MLVVDASRFLATALACRPIAPLAPRALTTRMQFISTIPGLPDHLQEMHEQLTSGEAQLYDVREPGEHAQGMLACSEPVPLSMLQEGMFANSDFLDKTKITYLHCAAGIRVHPAAGCLQAMGFERVIPLQEGFGSLANLGFPLEDAK